MPAFSLWWTHLNRPCDVYYNMLIKTFFSFRLLYSDCLLSVCRLCADWWAKCAGCSENLCFCRSHQHPKNSSESASLCHEHRHAGKSQPITSLRSGYPRQSSLLSEYLKQTMHPSEWVVSLIAMLYFFMSRLLDVFFNLRVGNITLTSPTFFIFHRLHKYLWESLDCAY